MIIDYRFGPVSASNRASVCAIGLRFDQEYRHPDFLESVILGYYGDDPPLVMERSSSWYMGIWQSPSRAVFVSDIAGAVIRNADPRAQPDVWTRDELGVTLDGIFGVADDRVFTWEVDSGQVFCFDGKVWKPLPALPERINAIHGNSKDGIIAVGNGIVAWWDGGRWQQIDAGDSLFNGVHMQSTDEVYAVTQDGQLFEGSVHGLQFLAECEGDVLRDVTKLGDSVYVATKDTGLRRLDGGELSLIDPEMPCFDLDARQQLFVACEDALRYSDDGDTFEEIPVSTFARLLDGRRPAWDPGADMTTVVDLARTK